MSSSLPGGARDPAELQHSMHHLLDPGYPPFKHFGSPRCWDLDTREDTYVQADSDGLEMTPREDVLAQVEGPEQNGASFLCSLSSLSEMQCLGKALPGAAVRAGNNILGQDTASLCGSPWLACFCRPRAATQPALDLVLMDVQHCPPYLEGGMCAPIKQSS